MNSQYMLQYSRYFHKGIIIDTNLLLLLLVGRLDPNFISTCPRTKDYSDNDYKLLDASLSYFNKFFATPNIITETNNLSNKIKGEYKKYFDLLLASYVETVDERLVASKNIVADSGFYTLGITDISIIITAIKRRLLVITDDLDMHIYATRNGVDSINFNHIRMADMGL